MLVSTFLDKIQLKYQFSISISIYSVDDSHPSEPPIVENLWKGHIRLLIIFSRQELSI